MQLWTLLRNHIASVKIALLQETQYTTYPYAENHNIQKNNQKSKDDFLVYVQLNRKFSHFTEN